MRELLKRGAWPVQAGIAAAQVLTVMQDACYMEPTLRAVRRLYSSPLTPRLTLTLGGGRTWR